MRIAGLAFDPRGFSEELAAAWYAYLAAAAVLSLAGYLTLDAALTGALALAVHLALHAPPKKSRLLTALIGASAAVAALALLWRESFLPPPMTIIDFLADPKQRPSARYLSEFLWQFLNLPMLAAGLALCAACFLVSRRKPLTLALCAYVLFGAAWGLQAKHGVLALEGEDAPAELSRRPVLEPRKPLPEDPFYDRVAALARSEAPAPQPEPAEEEAEPEGPSASPAAFYRKERRRVVAIPPPENGARPFDVILLHICSLSWKDIRDAGADLLPFFSRFDYVFTDFSAACSYSGPASLRLLKAPCGQMRHKALYDEAPASCYLLGRLRSVGFKTYTMTNNDGKYADFAVNVQKYGRGDPPIGIDGLPTAYRMFDDSPMSQDEAALSRFWKARQESSAPRAALYYNTANLHMGTHKSGVSGGPDDAASYRGRLEAMIAQLESFLSTVERSGRSAVVVFVPEHGAALTGTKMQAKDVRDIPLPPIATVPVAVRLVGKPFHADAAKPQVITKPASFLALAWLLAEFLRHDPFSKDARRPEALAAEVPGTEFLAEDENAAVMRLGEGYVYRLKSDEWKPLPEYALTPSGTIPSPQDFRKVAR
ncbi:MAG TPA: hypothetical protein DCM05_02330 [Elusimicrobia bacterium]|nr:hypothetical protein [Elusimicrobiota bacterium]